MTPFEIIYGVPLPIFIAYIPRESKVVAIDQQLLDWDAMLILLKKNLIQSQNRMKQQAYKHRSEREFEKGGVAYLQMQPLK